MIVHFVNEVKKFTSLKPVNKLQTADSYSIGYPRDYNVGYTAAFTPSSMCGNRIVIQQLISRDALQHHPESHS